MFENTFENDEKLITFQQRAQTYYNKASLFIITDNESYSQTAEDLKQIKTQAKTIEDYRKSITDPINEQVKRIKAMFDKPLDILKEAENTIKNAILNYQREENKKRLELENKLREDAEKKRIELEKKAEKAELKGNSEKADELRQQAEMANLTPVLQNTTPKVSGISTMKIWKFRIIDETKIPREYLIPNEKLLGSFAKSTKGAIKVAGIEFYEDETISAGRL